MSKQIEEVMGLVKEAIFCAATAQLCDSEHDDANSTGYQSGSDAAYRAIESKLRELLPVMSTDQADAQVEITKLRGALEKLKDAHNSEAASGGEMWYAEVMSPAVELAIKALE